MGKANGSNLCDGLGDPQLSNRNRRTIIDVAILAVFAAGSLAFLYGMMRLIAGHGPP
jgi:hypothetical protein